MDAIDTCYEIEGAGGLASEAISMALSVQTPRMYVVHLAMMDGILMCERRRERTSMPRSCRVYVCAEVMRGLFAHDDTLNRIDVKSVVVQHAD